MCWLCQVAGQKVKPRNNTSSLWPRTAGETSALHIGILGARSPATTIGQPTLHIALHINRIDFWEQRDATASSKGGASREMCRRKARYPRVIGDLRLQFPSACQIDPLDIESWGNDRRMSD